MSLLILVVLPVIYITIALLLTVPAWRRAFTAGVSYRSAWVRMLLMGLPFILLGVNRTLVWHADREVDRLRAKGGGVHVYETATLGPENFGSDGTVIPQYELLAAKNPGKGLRYGPDYAATSSTEVLREGRALFVPRVTRSVIRVVRNKDGKLLVEEVGYDRYGGDLPGPWTASSHSCTGSPYGAGIERLVFISLGSKQ